MRRAIRGSGFSSTRVTLNVGDRPATCRSARLVSPSWAKASSRIRSIRSVSPRSLPTVKSQAR
jgi:hypothetical protein